MIICFICRISQDLCIRCTISSSTRPRPWLSCTEAMGTFVHSRSCPPPGVSPVIDLWAPHSVYECLSSIPVTVGAARSDLPASLPSEAVATETFYRPAGRDCLNAPSSHPGRGADFACRQALKHNDGPTFTLSGRVPNQDVLQHNGNGYPENFGLPLQ